MEDDCSLFFLPFSLVVLCLCLVPVLVSSFVYHSARKRDVEARLKRKGVSMEPREACVGEVSSTSPATSPATGKDHLAEELNSHLKIYSSILSLNLGESSESTASTSASPSNNGQSSWLRSAQNHKFLLTSPPDNCSPLTTHTTTTTTTTATLEPLNGTKFALKPSRLKVADRPPPPSSSHFNLTHRRTRQDSFLAHQSLSSHWKSSASPFRPTTAPSTKLYSTQKDGLGSLSARALDNPRSYDGLSPGFVPRPKRVNGLRDAVLPGCAEGQSSKKQGKQTWDDADRTKRKKNCALSSTIIVFLSISLGLNAVLISPYLYDYFYS